MYRGFQLELRKYFQLFKGETQYYYYSVGEKLLKKHQNKVQLVLDDFLLIDGSIDGSKMQENWFPQIKADVFISHSHQDEGLAITLAGWLFEKFGLVSFIDSCVWGYADDLKELLIGNYRRHSAPGGFRSLYSFASSHVHMMLSVALNQMIDNTECLFFLNTPNSISFDAPDGTTSSPWIYSEIAISRLIRKKNLRRPERLCESRNIYSERPIKYRLPMDHLPIISSADLSRWVRSYNSSRLSNYPHALDTLYQLTDKKHER